MPSLGDISTWMILAQNGAAPPEGGDGGIVSSIPWSLMPLVIIGVLFYFMLIRPEQRKRTEHATMVDALKKNDHVVTIGGVHGIIVNAQQGSEDVILRIDESNNTKVRILRSAIARVVPEDTEVKKEGE
jgi:preprotein translocase subunit YajC